MENNQSDIHSARILLVLYSKVSNATRQYSLLSNRHDAELRGASYSLFLESVAAAMACSRSTKGGWLKWKAEYHGSGFCAKAKRTDGHSRDWEPSVCEVSDTVRHRQGARKVKGQAT